MEENYTAKVSQEYTNDRGCGPAFAALYAFCEGRCKL
jgi:hypothetical protein